MTDNVNTNMNDSSDFQEPPPTSGHGRRSSLSKMVDAIKKPFHHEKKENPPALQAAIDKMEARKRSTEQQMEAEGKDTSVLSGKRTDIVTNPLRG